MPRVAILCILLEDGAASTAIKYGLKVIDKQNLTFLVISHKICETRPGLIS